MPLVALLIDQLWLRRSVRRSMARLLPWIVMALVDIGVTKLLQADDRIRIGRIGGSDRGLPAMR